MKKSIQLLISIFFIYSCGTIPKFKKGTPVLVEKIGIMDTITVSVSGKILDLYEKFGLKGAEIELSNNKNSYYKVCRETGEFKFNHITSGKYLIKSTYLGYFTFSDSIVFKSGEIIKLTIGLGYDE